MGNYWLVERGHNYEEADFLINRYAIKVRVNNHGLNKVIPDRLYGFIKECKKKLGID